MNLKKCLKKIRIKKKLLESKIMFDLTVRRFELPNYISENLIPLCATNFKIKKSFTLADYSIFDSMQLVP